MVSIDITSLQNFPGVMKGLKNAALAHAVLTKEERDGG